MNGRLLSALAAGANTFLGAATRVARQLFHEATGAMFILFAIAGGLGAWREWRRGASQWLVALAIGFALMMVAFALASFRSARRVR